MRQGSEGEQQRDSEGGGAGHAGEWQPSEAQIAEVFAVDTEAERQKHFATLREIVSSLSSLEQRVQALGTGSKPSTPRPGSKPSTPRPSGSVPSPEASRPEEVAGGGAPSQPSPEASSAEKAEPEGKAARAGELLVKEEPDFGGEEGEVLAEEGPKINPEEMLKDMANATAEEAGRLCELLLEQRDYLQQLLDRQKFGSGELFEAILAEDVTKALNLIARARPDQLAATRDANGKTPLHVAVRLQNKVLVWALLEKAPALADMATYADRLPARFTALMVLADLPAQVDKQIAAALVTNMSLDGLNIRSNKLATATMLAVSRGHLSLIKRILFRINDLGGRAAAKAHLSHTNQQAPWIVLL